jgi:hypothetical protein
VDRPRRSHRAALAVLPVLVALVAGCSSGGKTQPADGEVTTSSPAMMTGAQMEQLQNALAAGVAKGPLSTSTTAVAGDTSSTAGP